MRNAIVVLFLLHIWHLSSSQHVNDSTIYRQFNKQIEFIESFELRYQSFLDSVKSLNTIFCSVNRKEAKNGDRLLNIYFKTYPLPGFVKHEFFLNSYDCFSNEQREQIKSILNAQLKESDLRFHSLVSLYKLGHFEPFLLSHINGDIVKMIKDDLKNSILSERTKFHLKSMATLANLGHTHFEDSLLQAVESIYYKIKTEGNRTWLSILYDQVIPNSIAMVNSRSMVRRSLYLLDEEDSGVMDSHTHLSFPYSYFVHVIEPKVKEGTFIVMTGPPFVKDKEKVREKILSDPNIWLDHIRE